MARMGAPVSIRNVKLVICRRPNRAFDLIIKSVFFER
jgi:hypothetical protein